MHGWMHLLRLGQHRTWDTKGQQVETSFTY